MIDLLTFILTLIRMNFNLLNQLSNPNVLIRQMITAASLKILMNYTQNIAILNTLNLNWGSKILEMFNIHKASSGGLQDVVSIECFFTGIFGPIVVFFYIYIFLQ